VGGTGDAGGNQRRTAGNAGRSVKFRVPPKKIVTIKAVLKPA
jgi:hypothetical protein